MRRVGGLLLVAAGLVAACSSDDSASATADAGGSNDAGDAGAVDASATDAIADTTPAPDGSSTADGGDAAAVGCGAFTGDTTFTCASDGNSRGECANGALDQESCPRGCLREPAGQDSVCLGAAGTNTFMCSGSYGTTPSTDGDYYLTSFGCWVDPQNVTHTDPDDNCIPSCFDQAKAAGLCMAGDTGPQCEERIDWFTADGARFGCLARLRVTNPATGVSVIAVALDYGPGCSGEQSVDMEVLDASGRVDLALFGGPEGSSDHALVHVVQVDDSTPLGPTP